MNKITPAKNPLRQQLEDQKYLNAADYVKKNAGGLKSLTTTELVYLNQLAGDHTGEAWRFTPIHLSLPSGRVHQFNVISNPINRARDIIGDAYQLSRNYSAGVGACHLYAQLVLEHLFNEANRRTAALGALWILIANDHTADAEALVRLKVGDLRLPDDLSSFQANFAQLVAPT